MTKSERALLLGLKIEEITLQLRSRLAEIEELHLRSRSRNESSGTLRIEL